MGKINTRTIEDASIYAYGSWTSPTLTNSNAGLPTDVTTEWGFLHWVEEYVSDGDGLVRIDILDADNSDAVLVENIIKNSDGSPTDLSSTPAATSNIKIKVKIYGLSDPTPKVSNIWIKYNNWIGNQVVTNDGKNQLLNRASLSSPTMNEINASKIGVLQTTEFTENSTALTSAVSSALAYNDVEFDTDNATIKVEVLLNETDAEVSNGEIMNAISFENDDTDPAFCGAARFVDITKSASYKYYLRGTFKITRLSTDYIILTDMGEYILLNRAFYASPSYTEVNRWILGEQSSLTNTMGGLDTETLGPSAFTYTLLDNAKHELTLRSEIDEDTGNGSDFNAIGHENTDSPSSFIYAALFDETITKTSTYKYLFTVIYKPQTPSNDIG